MTEEQNAEPVVEEPIVAPEPVEAETDLEDFDEEDVKNALERETQDGPGEDSKHLPPSDFEGFPADDVEEDE